MNYERGISRDIFFCVTIICLIFIFSSCKKHEIQKEQILVIETQEYDYQKALILDKIIQQEAMLVTIPIPLYDERILPTSFDFCEKETITLGYKSPFAVEQAIDFFMNQMERYGWKHIISFENNKSLLLFENPDSYCCIVIKPLNSYKSIIIIYIKRASSKSSLIGSELG